MTSKPETRLVKKIREALTRRFPGIYHLKIHGGPFQEVGIPDILVCWKGKFFGLEIKQPGLKPDDIQLEHIRRIRRAGGHAGFFDNVEDAINFIEKLS